MAYQLRIDIKGAKPPIWRRITIPVNCRFDQLHEAIQVLFGWSNSHLHEFKLERSGIILQANPEMDMYTIHDVEKTSDYQLSELLHEEEKFTYIYDFGDWHEHTIKVEKIVEQEAGYPVLVKWVKENVSEDGEMPVEFDEEYVKEKLERIVVAQSVAEDEEDSYLKLWSQLSDFSLTVKGDAILEVDLNGKDYYVLHTCSNKNQLLICETMNDLNMAYHRCINKELFHPFYQNGLNVIYPVIDFEDENYSEEGPAFAYFENGRYSRGVNDREFALIGEIVDFMHSTALYIKEKTSHAFPTVSRGLYLHAKIEGHHIDLKDKPLDLNMELQVLKADTDDLLMKKTSKVNTDRITATLMPVMDLTKTSFGKFYSYYFCVIGKRFEQKVKIMATSAEQLGEEVQNFFRGYFKEHGIIKNLSLDDPHLYQMLCHWFKELGIDVRLKEIDGMQFSQLYKESFMETNPVDYFNQDMIEMIRRNNESEIDAFMQRASEEERNECFRCYSYISVADSIK